MYLVKDLELLPIFKEHNLKSIHNLSIFHQQIQEVVTNIQRTQFKINSQQVACSYSCAIGCYQYSKNTI